MAPPVSLPTSVTSSSPSASMKAMTCRATPRGDWSASGWTGVRCDPSGRSGAKERTPWAANASAVADHSEPSTSTPWTKTTGGPAASTGPAVR